WFTRARYCTPRGRIAIDEKGPPGTQAPGLYPWYEAPGHAQRDLRIVCGHWSTLGLTIARNVPAAGTGAVRGRRRRARRRDGDERRVQRAPGRGVPATPPHLRKE